MNHYLYASVAVLVALLLAAACAPAPMTVAPATQRLAVPTALLPTDPLATQPPVPTAVPIAAVPTATDTPPPLTELPPTPSASPPLLPGAANGANADVLHVRAVEAADGSWTFHVTVEHPDTGWDDYADGWDVLTPDGTVLKPDPDSPFTRLLLHPHENEQPFTRSQSGIVAPAGVTQVRVRAHDLVDGFGGREVLVDLTVASGQGFEVEPSE